MNASSIRHARLAVPALLAPVAALVLLATSVPAPSAAGGLNDFLKKGGKEERKESKPSGSGGSSDRSTTPPASDRNRNEGFDVWRKPPARRDDAPPPSTSPPRTTEPRKGGLFDVFRKERNPSPSATTPGRPAPAPGATTPPSAGGGLFDLFRKRGKPQRQRQSPPPPVPPPVVYHYYDPWYYPYDATFYRYYGPYALREWDPFLGVDRFPYLEPEPPREEERVRRALRDIERGWKECQLSLITRYVDDDRPIEVYSDGDYSHSMSAREFRALTLQAFEDIYTIRFRFTAMRWHRLDEVRARGEHIFVGPDGEERRVELVYILRKERGRWLIRGVDMGRRSRFVSSLPRAAEEQEPAISLARYNLSASTTGADALPLDAGVDSGYAYAAPQASDRPRLTYAARPIQVASVAPARTLLAMAAAQRRATRAPVRAVELKITCVSFPVSMEAVQKGQKPVRAATISYQAPGRVPSTYKVEVRPVKRGFAWRIENTRNPKRAEKGVLDLEEYGLDTHGYLQVEVGRVSVPMGYGPGGDVFVPLFSRKAWDYQAGFRVSPRPRSSARNPARTELTVTAAGTSVPSRRQEAAMAAGPPMPGMGHGGGKAEDAGTWATGQAAFNYAMQQLQVARRPLAIFFYRGRTDDIQQFNKRLLFACRLQEFLAGFTTLRADLQAGPANMALAARFGVTKAPAFVLVSPKGGKPRQVQITRNGNWITGTPCSFIEECQAVSLGVTRSGGSGDSHEHDH